MNLDFNYDGKTKLKDWWGKVKANFQTLQDGFNEHRENTTLDHPDKSVKQQHIADKAVGTGQIADYAVGQSQLQQYSVSSAKIYPGAVKTTHLADNNVTTEKIAAGAVKSGNISDGSITNVKLSVDLLEMINTATENVKIFQAMNNSINHRNIFRGEYLGDMVTEGTLEKIRAGIFENLYIGDYWEVNDIKWRIVDMDYWYKSGIPELDKHHLVIMPDSPLYDHSMNDTAENAGGYVGSLMYTEGLNEAKRIINEMFGDSVIEHEENFVDEVTDGKAASTVWTSTAVDLPSELMIFGSNTLSENRLDVSSTNQLALFRMAPEFLNDRHGFWLRDAVATNNSFAFTDGLGRLIASGGISTDMLGVRPVFAIG